VSKPGYHPALNRFTILTTFLTWILIIAGSLVTSTESGLSVPDWPLSYGQVFPPMVGGIRFEHTHRVIAGLVALLTLIQTIWIWRTETRKWVKRLSLFSFILIVMQAVLGGLTVLLLLPPPISILHAFTAQTFFSILVIIGLTGTHYWWKNYEAAPPVNVACGPKNLLLFSRLTLASLFLQLIFGAMKRHHVAGMHLHFLGALLVVVMTFSTFTYINKCFAQKKDVWVSGLLLCVLVLAELFLGLHAYAVRLRNADEIVPSTETVLGTASHVAVGALVLASATVLFLICLGIRRNARISHSSK